MRLDEYQWSRNPRGMHNQGVFRYSLDRYQQIHAGWVKLVAGDTEFVGHIPELLANGMTPIVRIYRAEACGQPADEGVYTSMQRYLNAGARWFELWNEPNLNHEWPQALQAGLDPNNIGTYIAPLMDNWIVWAERIAGMGGYPAFIPLAESSEMPHAAIPWLRNMVNYLADNYYTRFRTLLATGLWCATHPYIFNHFYQERAGGGPLSMRSPAQQNAAEGGWHFEYPYDPVGQADDPGRTVWGGTSLTPLGDPLGLTAMGIAFMGLLQERFGGGVVPVVGTEGGIWPWPGPGEPPSALDDRYPGYTWNSHAEVTVAMFDWIANSAPSWMFGVALWKEDHYWEGEHGVAPAVQRLAETAAPRKEVPALDTLDGVAFAPTPTPPIAPVPTESLSPVHGTPDFHFILLTPELDADWFFDAAEAYWTRYQPVLIDASTLDVLELLPAAATAAVTAITLGGEQIAMLNEQVRDRWPNVWYDLIVVETAYALADTLNQRITSGRRFG
ncbi:MAG: hypothetical protein JW910_17100 [Anaerolineae bacterium]|nr:hypothetical protein [Anaerolineae bacterium]